MFKVEGGNYHQLRDSGQVLHIRRGYIIGYRGCVSNPSRMYYIYHHDVSMEFCGFSINGARTTIFCLVWALHVHLYTAMQEHTCTSVDWHIL